ncbi:polysaccharide deacetylase family protein [Actinomycetospora sp. TBRC 11914]|uniref:polysaccharide deacetylase family protein n=1 Tax=Actinomycetospora sp. TBRC 11914 TaxID=2729387 RepID=UPI0020071784|nr:polysaccharide deacetylase family protein [Actinomycetospora sp. TBRC 11914]
MNAAPSGRPTSPLGRRGSTYVLLGLAIAVLSASALMFPTADTASPNRPLTVSLTFDDGRANQMVAQQLLKKHAMTGTFYINSSSIEVPGGHMTRGDLDVLEASGNEVGGHSANHLSLSSLSTDEAERQVCTDRNTLLSWGHAATSFAYPFSDLNATVQSIAARCGYDTARTVGGLRSPRGCTDCPATEPTPPADIYATRTAADVDETWTLEELENTVTKAEATNGGWLTFVFHDVCDGCEQRSIRASVLDQFLTWLQARSALHTTVKTVREAVGGSMKPPAAPPPPPPPGGPGVNTVRNPSLETVSPVDADLPRCFESAGYGDNSVTFSRVNDAHSGKFGERLTMNSWTEGDAKLLPLMDLGECSNQVTSGRRYEVSAWYKSDVEVSLRLFTRNAVGQWTFWTYSPPFSPASGWTRASWISPATPADALAVSFGLAIDRVGTLTTDDYGFAEVPRLTSPAVR